MKKKKPLKGQMSYISNRKKTTIIRTILLFSASFAVLGIGYFSTGSLQNYFTIIGVLGMLPAARSAVEMIISLRVKEIDKDLYKKLENIVISTDFDLQYNLYFTSESRNYAVDALFVTNNCIIGLKVNPKYDCKDAKKHIETYMKKDGYIPKNINIMTEESKFISAIKNNLKNKPTEQDLKMEYSLKLLSV